jgi:hydrogenase small subunit
MEISRRDFFKYVSASATLLGLSAVDLSRVEEALAGASSPPVVWLSGSACTGCSVSLLNAVNPTIDQVLLNTISLKYHPNVMAAAGDMAVQAARSTAQAGNHILVIEGAIPTANSGKWCYVWDEAGAPVTMAEAVRSLAATAKYIVSVGACASFGGIPAANRTAGALALLIAGTPPALDSNRRPKVFYTPKVIHERCPRKEREEAHRFGQDGLCLKELGCKGPITHADCDTRKWNNAQNWCIGANGLCIGCTEPSFPAFPLHGEAEGDDD